MQLWKLTVLVCGCLLMAACGDESEVKKAIKESLKDPDSAKFGEVTFVKKAKGTTYGCMTFNAKNSMGGYVGDKQALFMKVKDEWYVITAEAVPHERCVQIISDMKEDE